MRIEDEIKQDNFGNEYQKLAINQLFTGKWVSDLIANHLKPYALSTQQYNVLRILRGARPEALTVNAICERMIDKMSNVSRLVDKLILKDLVIRKVNFNDRRQMDIEITKKGLNILKEIDEKDPLLFDNFSNLSIEEARDLNNLLDKLRG